MKIVCMKQIFSAMFAQSTKAQNISARHSSVCWNPVKVDYATIIFNALMSFFILNNKPVTRYIAAKLSMLPAWIPACAGMTKFVSLNKNLAGNLSNLSLILFALQPAPALAAGAISTEYRWLTFLVFSSIIAATMYIIYWASKRVKSTTDFYAAGNSISGLQNGWAIAGDYLSAASFLGIAGLISLYGFDGFMYSVGFLMGYIAVLLVIAEPCRNIGKYTLGDILAFRNDPKKARIIAAISTITVSIFYLTAQMVGGGELVKTLIGIDYEVSVIAVGTLMLAYVVFGGMVATTYVQIVKAVLLVIASLVVVTLVWLPYGFSLPAFLQAVVDSPKVQAKVAKLLGAVAETMTPQQLGQRF